MKKKVANNTVVRLTPENTKRIAEYKRREPFCPNTQTIVNFAVGKFLDALEEEKKQPPTN